MKTPLKFGTKLTRAARAQILRRIQTLHAQGLALHVACAVTYVESVAACPTMGADHYARLMRMNRADWEQTLRPEGEAHATERHETRRTRHGHNDANGRLKRYFVPALDWAMHARNGHSMIGEARKYAEKRAREVFDSVNGQIPGMGGQATPDPAAPANTTGKSPVAVATPNAQKNQGDPTPAAHIDAPQTTQAPGPQEIAPVTLPSQLGTRSPMRDGGQGSPDAILRMPGEAGCAAALVDALKGRRRSETRRGLDSGELDLSPSRLALTGGGLDLARAWQRRTAPDTKRTLVGVLLDYSGSMKAGEGSAEGSRYNIAARAAAMILRALEREKIACTAWRYAGAGAEPVRKLHPTKTPLRDALRQLDMRPDGSATDAPRAADEAARAMLKIRADRRVLVVLCDDDMRPDDGRWPEIERAGVEVWGISIAKYPTDDWRTLPDCAGWAARWRTGANHLPAGWAAAMRAGIGRIEV